MAALSFYERRQRIAQVVLRQGTASVRELSGMFGVSMMTIRRDLQLLALNGLVKRGHGMAATSELTFEHPYAAKAVSNREGKGRIASLATGMISSGDTVILDSGSTTFELARRLRLLKDLTVITNDLKIALELSDSPTCTVICLGGTVQNRVYAVLGHYVEGMLSGFRANKAFIGASGICPDGVFTPTIEKAPIKRAMIASADESYLLIDHTKFGKRALVRVCDPTSFTGMVTDRAVDGTVLEQLKSTSLKILTAPSSEEGDRTPPSGSDAAR